MRRGNEVGPLEGETHLYLSFLVNSIKIYPNPAKEYIILSALENDLQVEIYDMLGKKILQTQTLAFQTKINIDSISKGVYLVKISNSKSQYLIQKIIIE